MTLRPPSDDAGPPFRRLGEVNLCAPSESGGTTVTFARRAGATEDTSGATKKVAAPTPAAPDGEQQPLAVLLSAFEEGDVQGLRTTASGCPACMLSAIIAWQNRELEAGASREEGDVWVDFDFKAETAAMWKQHNEAAAEADYQAQMEYELGIAVYGGELPF